MLPASVGFQCPACAGGLPGRGGHLPRRPRTTVGARLGSDFPIATTVIVVAMVVLSLANLVTSLPAQLLAFFNAPGALSQPWRPVTYLLLQDFPWGLLVSGFMLFLVGRVLEPLFGRWRFIAVYALAGLGGAAILSLFGPIGSGWYGGYIGALGMIAANAMAKLKSRQDIRPDLLMLALLVGVNVVLNWRSMAWLGMIGGLIGAGVATLIIVFAPRDRRTLVQLGGLVGLAVIFLVGIALGPALRS